MKKKYHAHVYFRLSEVPLAQALLKAIEALYSPEVQIGQFHLRPVGPHPVPMVTLEFDSEIKEDFIQFLIRNRESLTILIHEDTGDDYYDHSEGAQWLGEKLQLNFDHFERIKYDKSALVFPE